MLRRGALIVWVLLGAALAACGQKGPLYVPGVAPQARWPYPAVPPAAPAPAPQTPDLPGVSDERQ